MSKDKMRVFISYSRIDKQWFERLKVHLRPLSRDHDIDIWEDTRITPGSRWREEIRRAVDGAHAAVLLISPDYLASDFINTDELPPLLKAAEEEGTLILPIVVGPSLFSRNQELSQFQCVNDPSQPLVLMGKTEQEQTFVKVAEAILDFAGRRDVPSLVTGSQELQREIFLDPKTWTRLLKIGDWIFDKDNSLIIGSGMNAYLLSRNEFGSKSFALQARLTFSNFQQHLNHEIHKMNAGIILGWNSEKANPRYLHIMLTGEALLVEKIGYNGGSVYEDYEHLTEPEPLLVEAGREYSVTVRVDDEQIKIVVNGQQLLTLPRPTGLVGRVGLRPWRSQLSCKEFTVSG